MVLLHDALPAYISWEAYEHNQDQMAANRSRHTGVPRGGAALLGGLVTCAACGRRMVTTYSDDGRDARYVCNYEITMHGGARCQSISARPVDACVSALILEALLPSAIDVSFQVAEDIELERRQADESWKQRIERADYEAALARRRYEAVDPDNRLVARSLEADWDAKLAKHQSLIEEHQRAIRRQPMRLTAEEKETVQRLADDVPALWKAETTSPKDRQTIARIMLERVVIQLVGETERAEVSCHWAGGAATTSPLVRTIANFEKLEHFNEILARVAELRAQGMTARKIADDLNAKGWRPAKSPSSMTSLSKSCLPATASGKSGPYGLMPFHAVIARKSRCRSLQTDVAFTG
jgi:hypothetical protein